MTTVLACSLVLSACGKKEESPRAPLPAVTVREQAVEAKPHVAVEEVVGTVVPRLRAAIEPKVSGRIQSILATPGQEVKAGALLAELDVREMQSKLDQAKAVSEQAAMDYKRIAGLVDKGAATKQEFEAAQSRSRVAVAAVEEAQTMLGYARIEAPFDGVITKKLANVGDLSTPGRPIFEMEDPKSLQFEAWIPDGIVDRLKLGLNLGIRTAGQEVEAKVVEIAPSSDPASRTSLVKLDLPAGAALRAGQFGRVSVPVSTTSVLRVPASAVIQRGQMELVFVDDAGRARLRIVKTGKRIGDEVEILSGVESGERVIHEGVNRLVDGQPVEVKP